MDSPLGKQAAPSVAYNTNLKFISFAELQTLIKCDQNKKIIDDWIDFLVGIEPLEDRSPVPFDQVLKKDK